MSRLIVLAALGTALAGCSAIPGLPGSETKTQNISMQSTPPGAEVSFAGGTSCHTPCSLATPGNNGTYYAKFSLDGYQPTSIPVKVTHRQGELVFERGHQHRPADRDREA